MDSRPRARDDRSVVAQIATPLGRVDRLARPPLSRSSEVLPPTVNLHLVARCNMRCRYCYARFEQQRKAPLLPTAEVLTIMRQLVENGVRRVTFAGGEPTLHKDLQVLLKQAEQLGLVTSIVTNGFLIDEAWLAKHGPFLRWLTLSIDSIDAETTRGLGRHAGPDGYRHPDHVLAVAELIHRWNAARPPSRRIRLKLNITVTSRNAHEDPGEFIREMRPEKVKLLQMLPVEGENDDARDLACSTEAFANYVARVGVIDGVQIAREDNVAMDGSYAMVDPCGQFFQRVDGRYVRSKPIQEVGVMQAWEQVGGYDPDRFLDRGGAYEPGAVANGNLPYLIAIEGLDGTGKSTTVQALAARLGAEVVHNPPMSMAGEREAADQLEPAARRAWYLEANREASRQAEEIRARGNPVVMDRSVASTLAFGAAERNEPVDPWPDDIPEPDLLAVLTVSDEERLRRLAGRSGARTREEQRLGDDRSFRDRIAEAYVRLGGVTIDASGSAEEVVSRVLHTADSVAEAGR